jgi:fimbrial chaperone protein
MTRPTGFIRTIALALAGGSFTLGTVPAVHAEEPGPTPAPAAAPAAADFGARLNIAPLRLELDATHPGATLRLTNTSARPLPVQTRLFAWTQDGGEDSYAPSTELTISPSIIAIAPGQTQIVRVLRSGPASAGEKHFRLAVDQLPDPRLAKSGVAEARLRFTIPVFLDRDKAPPAQLTWRMTGGRIEVANAGGLTARILEIQAKTSAGRALRLDRNTVRYVLGGSTIGWPVAEGCAAGPVTIVAQIDGQTVNAQVAPSCS